MPYRSKSQQNLSPPLPTKASSEKTEPVAPAPWKLPPAEVGKGSILSRLRNKHANIDASVPRRDDPKFQSGVYGRKKLIKPINEDEFLSDKVATDTVETEPAKSKAPDTKEPKKPTEKDKSFPLDTNKKSPTPSTDVKKKFVTPSNPKGKGKAAEKSTPKITEKSPLPVKGKKELSITESVRLLVREVLDEILNSKK